MESLTIKVTVAWWLPLYIKGLALTCALTGLEPDWDKVNRTVKRALRTRVFW